MYAVATSHYNIASYFDGFYIIKKYWTNYEKIVVNILVQMLRHLIFQFLQIINEN